MKVHCINIIHVFTVLLPFRLISPVVVGKVHTLNSINLIGILGIPAVVVGESTFHHYIASRLFM